MNLAEGLADLRRRVQQRARLVTGTGTTDAEWTVYGGTVRSPQVAPALALQGEVAYSLPTPLVAIEGVYDLNWVVLTATGNSGNDWEKLPSTHTNDSLWTWTAPHDGWLHVTAGTRIGYMSGSTSRIELYLRVEPDYWVEDTDYVGSGEHYTRDLNYATVSYDTSREFQRSVWLREGVATTPQLWYRTVGGTDIPRTSYTKYSALWVPGPKPAKISATDGGSYP